MNALTFIIVSLSITAILWTVVTAVLRLAAVVSWSWWLIAVPGVAVALIWGVGWLLIYFAIRNGNGQIY